ncbi:MAG: hypothetical protein KF688_11660 [Pirellulales bacterium]|nr:hypothetical protein [Pirellulales bacterium]
MPLFDWLTKRFSPRIRAAWHYRRGVLEARAGRNDSAIIDYTIAVEMPETAPDVRAMALFNRALAYSTIDDRESAVDDLSRLLEMPAASVQIKTEARRKLLRMKRSDER